MTNEIYLISQVILLGSNWFNVWRTLCLHFSQVIMFLLLSFRRDLKVGNTPMWSNEFQTHE